MGGMMEEGLKSSKFMSFSAIKATTQAIQGCTGGVLGNIKKDDVDMVVSGSWHGPRGSPHQYAQLQPQPQAYTQAPYNPPQHYFPPQDPQYSIRPPQYHVHHAQSYAQPPPYPQWHAPNPQSSYLPPPPYRNPTGPSFRARPDYRKKGSSEKKLTPLGESYTGLFQRLRQLDVLRLIESKLPNPPPRNLDYSLRCAYCSDAPGYDTEKCWHLKKAI
nr:pollen-specific leucine-rich repeat extensin-like protein 2 [Nicotiana tomentosiformis]